jgi:hypothetical protein
MASPPTGTGSSESTSKDDYTPLSVRWGKTPPRASDVFFPGRTRKYSPPEAGYYATVGGDWTDARCRALSRLHVDPSHECKVTVTPLEDDSPLAGKWKIGKCPRGASRRVR